MDSIFKVIVVSLFFGALAGGIVFYALAAQAQPAATNAERSTSDLIRDFYLTENAVHVSPHSLRGKMGKGVDDFVLVDLRSAEEYNNSHIIGAVNIPAYSDKNTSAYGDVERIVSAFKALPPGKEVIVYCYSVPCMTGRKVGKMLAENGIYVKHLGIGWNEWRYGWTQWNHEHEWNITKAEDYIWSGPEPGIPKSSRNSTVCPINNTYGC